MSEQVTVWVSGFRNNNFYGLEINKKRLVYLISVLSAATSTRCTL